MTADALPAKGCPSGLSVPDFDGTADLSAFVTQAGGTNAIELTVRGAKCAGCLSKIESKVWALEGVETARLNLSNGRLRVKWRGPLSANAIAETISDIGYGVSPRSSDDPASAAKTEERKLLIAMGIAGFAAANIMLLSISVWAGHGEMGEQTRQTLHALSGLIALPVLLFSGRVFFESAWSVLRRGHANMDVPISLALTLAYGVSVWETLQGGEHAYFDACVMLLFFLLIGRFLDARLRRQTHAAAHELAALSGGAVTRLSSTGEAISVRADEIERGDRILLAPGERATIDLVIQSGSSDVDESLVTGESIPSRVGPGSTLYAGSVNLGEALTGEALGNHDSSLLSDLARMLEAGEQRRSTYRKISDRAVSLYIPFVHTTAALTFAGWLLAGADLRTAIMIAVATLIITCPCALALAAPVVQIVASGRLYKSGTYLKSGDALERLAEIDHVVLDKTGTLTLGTPILKAPAPERLREAAKLARASRHPLSRALVTAAGTGPVAQDVKEHAGLGLEAHLNGVLCRLGSAEWVGAQTQQRTDGPSLWFSYGDEAPILFEFEDHIQPGTEAALRALEARGCTLEVLSGDRTGAVEALANRLGIEDWTAQALPGQKVEKLQLLTAEGRRVLMVGDGLNDAGALALAHASLAPGGAIDISQSACDAVYSKGISAIPGILQAARDARRGMKQNFALAAAYNLIAVPIAVSGNVTPLVAAIAMSASSLIVTLNALRLTLKPVSDV